MKLLKTVVYGILGGICISIGGAAFLSADSKVVGAIFFVVGLFTICTMGFYLFTGKVCYVFENPLSYTLLLLPMWLSNFLGAWLTGEALRLTTFISIAEKSALICETKFSGGLLSTFILAVFCNILIYIAVDGYKNNPHELGKYLSLFFGVTVFIICGFEHSVANMFYISVAGAWSGNALIFIVVNSIGNAVGGVLLPLAKKIGAKESV